MVLAFVTAWWSVRVIKFNKLDKTNLYDIDFPSSWFFNFMYFLYVAICCSLTDGLMGTWEMKMVLVIESEHDLVGRTDDSPISM